MALKNSILDLNLQKILVRSTNWIGDAVMTSPAVHTIRKNFPDAEITMLAVPWVADIFSSSPDVDKLFIYDKKDRYQGKVKGPLRLARDLKEQGFDAAILLQNAFEAAFIAKIASIPIRAGYRRDGRSMLLSHGVTISHEIRKRHQVHYYQNMLAGVGLTPGSDHLRITLAPDMERWAGDCIDSLLRKGAVSQPDPDHSQTTMEAAGVGKQAEQRKSIPLIGFNPGAAFGPAKQWPVEKFAQLAALIAHHHGESGCLILVFGTEVDTPAAREIQQFSMRTPSHVVDMTGKTSLQQAMALIKRCDAFVTNDSGLMHVAAGLETPSVAIFGSTDHIATGPYSKNSVVLRREIECSPCLQTHCAFGHLKCMESISSPDVYEEVDKLLSKSLGIHP